MTKKTRPAATGKITITNSNTNAQETQLRKLGWLRLHGAHARADRVGDRLFAIRKAAA